MSEMIEREPQQLEKRKATFAPRDTWPLRDGVEPFVGTMVTVQYAGYALTAEDRAQYAGERVWAVVMPAELGRAVGWIAEGDLRFLPDVL